MFVALQQANPPATHTPTPAEKKLAVRSAASLTLVAIVIIFIVGAAALVLISRHKRRLLADPTLRRKKKAKSRPDPWSESANRLDLAAIASRDDTVDIDPDELGPGDVDGPHHPPHDPHGEGPNQ